MSKKNRSGLSVLLGQQKQYVPHGIQLSAVEYILTSQLKNNPQNEEIFTEESEEYFEQLRNDIRERGILVPLIATKEGLILAGHNRLRIAKEIGLERVPCQFVSEALTDTQQLEILIKDNVLRRQLTTEQWISIYRRLYPAFDVLARQENRGGNRFLIAEPDVNKLTAKKIAADTGQTESAVKKHLTQFRRGGDKKRKQTPVERAASLTDQLQAVWRELSADERASIAVRIGNIVAEE